MSRKIILCGPGSTCRQMFIQHLDGHDVNPHGPLDCKVGEVGNFNLRSLFFPPITVKVHNIPALIPMNPALLDQMFLNAFQVFICVDYVNRDEMVTAFKQVRDYFVGSEVSLLIYHEPLSSHAGIQEVNLRIRTILHDNQIHASVFFFSTETVTEFIRNIKGMLDGKVIFGNYCYTERYRREYRPDR